jgi:hypothetical protein
MLERFRLALALFLRSRLIQFVNAVNVNAPGQHVIDGDAMRSDFVDNVLNHPMITARTPFDKARLAIGCPAPEDAIVTTRPQRRSVIDSSSRYWLRRRPVSLTYCQV